MILGMLDNSLTIPRGITCMLKAVILVSSDKFIVHNLLIAMFADPSCIGYGASFSAPTFNAGYMEMAPNAPYPHYSQPFYQYNTMHPM
jgi:hypothetical protein